MTSLIAFCVGCIVGYFGTRYIVERMRRRAEDEWLRSSPVVLHQDVPLAKYGAFDEIEYREIHSVSDPDRFVEERIERLKYDLARQAAKHVTITREDTATHMTVRAGLTVLDKQEEAQ